MVKLKTLLDKFWSDTISVHELESLKQLLQALREEKGISILDDIDVSAKPSLSDQRVSELLGKIHQRTSGNSVPNTKKTVTIRNNKTFWLGLSGVAAAAIVLIMLVGSSKGIRTSDTQKNLSAFVFGPIVRQIENFSDTIMVVHLPDNSVVQLYPQSNIRFARNFEKNKRDIILNGAALFEVAKDKIRPFTVYAAGIATTALGTRFKVDIRSDTRNIQLYEGKVVIRPTNSGKTFEQVYIKAGEQFILSKDFKSEVKSLYPQKRLAEADTKTDRSAKGQSIQNGAQYKNPMPLAFRNTPLDEVLHQLEKKYGVYFEYSVSQQLKSILFTGHFDNSASLADVVQIICRMNNLQYVIKGKTIEISSRQ